MGHEGTIFPVIRVRVSDGQIQYDHFAVMKAAVAIGNDLSYTLVDIGFCLQKEPFFMQQFPNGFGIWGICPIFPATAISLQYASFQVYPLVTHKAFRTDPTASSTGGCDG